MPRASRQIALFISPILAILAADTKDDKSTPAPISVKLALDKTEPPVSVKYAFLVDLPSLCIADKLDTDVEPQKVPPHGCPKDTRKVKSNVDDLVTAFTKATEYIPQKADDSHIRFFCAAKVCNVDKDKARITADINASAKPSPRYYEDFTAPSKVKAADLAEAIERMTKGDATGRLLPSGQIRVETNKRLDLPDIADLRDEIASATPARLKSFAALPSPFNSRLVLPLFCIATTLDGPEPTIASEKARCQSKTQKVHAANASVIASALKSDKVKVIADTPSSIVVSCGASKCDSDALKLITTNANAMARPQPAYFEDLPVLPDTSQASAAKIKKWYSGLIAAQVLNDDAIRLASDSQIPSGDVEILKKRLLDEGYVESLPNPTKQLFYFDAGAVVASLAGSPPVLTPLATGTTPSDTSGGSQAAASSASTSAATPTPATSTPSAALAAATTPAAPAAATPATPAAPLTLAPSAFATGMTPVGDTVVLSGRTAVSDSQRIRLLTLLDLPRPEVLMNMWSLQESSPNGKDLAARSQLIRSAVSVNNEALQNAIEYGWAYLSRQMQNPDYFDKDFASYLTQRFVSDPSTCIASPSGPECIGADRREKWGLCPEGAYCLGYTEAFKPLKPTLTNILVGLMAAKDPFQAVFTAIGCMEGKYEVYRSICFPERDAIMALGLSQEASPKNGLPSGTKECLTEARKRYLDKLKDTAQPSCEDLDRSSLEAQRQCNVPPALPLGCFTIQAAKSFVPYHGFSTFTTRLLDELAEKPIADIERELPANETALSTTPLGLLRAATANFLFNYKMAQEFPAEFSTYRLTHSAQELNAEFNPLVVAFNQDVAAFSRDLMQNVESTLHDSHWYTFPWDGRNRSFAADGIVTVRGISGVESLVDTETQSAFSAPQYQTLPSVLSNLAGLAGSPPSGPAGSTTTTSSSTVNGDTTTGTSTTAPTPPPAVPSGGPPGFNLQTVLAGGITRASLPVALAAALSPTGAQAQIGRQLTLDIVPHALPGASSAELDIKLWAQEDSPPTLYKDGGTSSQNEPLSRVARHNVFTRVRVESVKLFEVSSFSALVQRPRTKFPLIPPFVEIPFINDIIGLPLPGAKVYYRSTAIVSAVIVPTAADLAFGVEFAADRATTGKDVSLSFRRIGSIYQLPREQQKLYEYNQARANCFATRSQFAITTTSSGPSCADLRFESLPPDR